MPVDTELFNMHEQAVLEAMPADELQAEFMKTTAMRNAVEDYRVRILKATVKNDMQRKVKFKGDVHPVDHPALMKVTSEPGD